MVDNKKYTKYTYDLCIIGGGINGAAVAAKASSLGLKVFLCEKNDFASGTSSSSTKLIHGGLRYLEHYNFKLVRLALKERIVLQQLAPHIIWPIEFILVCNSSIRNNWLIRIGLFLYDFLGTGSEGYRKTQFVDLNKLDNNNIFQAGYKYTDLWVDDSRLVILNIIQAVDLSAVVHKNTAVTSAEYILDQQLWQINLLNIKSQEIFNIKSKIIINAAGPWVNNVLLNNLKLQPFYNIKLVKGSHVITKKLYNHDKSYVLQHADHRIVFVIPYEDDFTLIGTTEISYNQSNLSEQPRIAQSEIDYLITVYNNYFKNKIYSSDVIYSYSGVRPLLYDEKAGLSDNTRDYKIDLYNQSLINIYGGKITTYRKLAEQVMNLVLKSNTNLKSKALPGAEIILKKDEGNRAGYNRANHNSFILKLKNQYPWLPDGLAMRYVRTYGSLVYKILDNLKSLDNLGIDFGADLYQKEVDYLINYEFADCAEDILWRRTKMGLRIDQNGLEKLNNYLKTKIPN